MIEAVLEAMVPGTPMTSDEILERVRHSKSTNMTVDEVNALLSQIHHGLIKDHEIVRNVDCQTWIRPIVIGMGGTVHGYSDRHAVTVIAVSITGYKVTTRDDRAIRLDGNGMSDSQVYKYERDPEGAVRVWYRSQGGHYRNGTKGGTLTLGTRDKYHDYSF